MFRGQDMSPSSGFLCLVSSLLTYLNIIHYVSRTGYVPIFRTFFASTAPVVLVLLMIEVSRSHSDTSHSVYSSGRVIGPSQWPLFDNTQKSLLTDIHAVGGIRTRNPSQRASADPRLRPRGHRTQNLRLAFFKTSVTTDNYLLWDCIRINIELGNTTYSTKSLDT
jgi:hypothetical protein